MQTTKNKNVISRLVAIIFAAMVLTIVFAFSTVSVTTLAAEEAIMTEDITENNKTAETAEAFEENFDSAFAITGFEAAPISDTGEGFKIVPLAGGGAAAGGGSGSGSTDADTAFQRVVNFFITWFRRIGMLVAFVGAIMFGLAIKNNDAEQKQAGLITMVAGFVVAAICAAVDMFDLFS